MIKITFLVAFLIAICVEFKETSACGSGPPCKDQICEWNGNNPLLCYCPNGPDKKSMMDHIISHVTPMKERYLSKNLFTPENLYKIAGAIHKEIHETIDGINKKIDTSVRGIESMFNPEGPG